MPELKVDFITNKSDNGAPEVLNGITIPSEKTISGTGNINVSGTLTANSFTGDGSALVNLVTSSKAYAIKLITDPLPFKYWDIYK